MSVETQTKQIGGVRYDVSPFPGRKGLRLQYRLLKVIGTPISVLFGAAKGVTGLKDESVLDKEVNPEVFGKAIEMLFKALSEIEFEALILELLSSTRKDNVEITPNTFDVAFAGDYGQLFEVLAYVLEVNYKSFLDRIGIGKLFAKEA